MTRTALIVGTGLIGTSMGLSLSRQGWGVWLQDEDERSLGLAVSLGAGVGTVPDVDPTVIVVATPPSSVPLVVSTLSSRFLPSTFIDVSSTKTHVQAEIQKFGLVSRFLGTHPMAGRERSGPDGARADLFEGRPWVICPVDDTPSAVTELGVQLIVDCGGRPIRLTPEMHDEAVARVSHVPQLIASSLAAGLMKPSAEELELAGQGLRDTSRIAGSDPNLWVDILTSNAAPVADDLALVIDELVAVQRALQALATQPQTDKSINGPGSGLLEQAQSVVRDLLTRGQTGYSRIPGKHGARAVEYFAVPVVIPDEPGALAQLLTAAGEAGINVEDLAIEHSPGHPVGLVELMVEPAQAPVLSEALTALGWSVH